MKQKKCSFTLGFLFLLFTLCGQGQNTGKSSPEYLNALALIDSLNPAFEDAFEVIQKVEKEEFEKYIDSLVLQKEYDFYKNALAGKDSFFSTINWFFALVTLFITGFLIQAWYSHSSFIRNSKAETQKMFEKKEEFITNVNAKSSKVNTDFVEIKGLISTFKGDEQSILKNISSKEAGIKVLYQEVMDTIEAKEQYFHEEFQLLEEKNLKAFQALHNDLLQFCIEIIQNKNNDDSANGEKELLSEYESKFYEHQTILALYSYFGDWQRINRKLHSLKELGTKMAIPHITYLKKRIENSEYWESPTPLLREIVDFIHIVIYEINQRNRK